MPSSFTALLWLKGKLYAICYLLGNPLKYTFIAYKYRCRACHSADELILAICYIYLCHEHTACCCLSGCMRSGCYLTIGNSVCLCIVTIKFDVCCHSSCYRIHILIRNGYCALISICHLHLCTDGFRIKVCVYQ